MPVYAKRLNGKQRRLLQQYEALTCIEPAGQEDLDSGKTTFRELWRCNLEFLFAIYSDVQNLDTRGTGA